MNSKIFMVLVFYIFLPHPVLCADEIFTSKNTIEFSGGLFSSIVYKFENDNNDNGVYVGIVPRLNYFFLDHYFLGGWIGFSGNSDSKYIKSFPMGVQFGYVNEILNSNWYWGLYSGYSIILSKYKSETNFSYKSIFAGLRLSYRLGVALINFRLEDSRTNLYSRLARDYFHVLSFYSDISIYF